MLPRPVRAFFRFGACLFLPLLTAFSLAAPQPAATEFLQRPQLSGRRGGSLIASVAADPRTFNRLLAFDLTGGMIADLLSADLVHFDRVSFELMPALASRWELAPDGRTYTLHLRKGVRFSDGVPFTADDVVFTLRVVLDPKVASSYAAFLTIDGTPAQVIRVDASTVRLVFPRPTGRGLRALDTLSILPKHRLERAYLEGRLASAWGPSVNPSELAGLGPFRLKEYQPGIRLTLERNPYYWKKDAAGQTLPYLDTLSLLIIPDSNAEVLRFKSGEIDVLGVLDPESYPALRQAEAEGKIKAQDLGPGLEFDFIWFNLNPGRNPAGVPYVDPAKRAVFEKSDFRRAFSHALNRDGMAKSILLGLGAPQYGPVAPGNKAWFDAGQARTDYNPDRARTMLEALGLKDTDGDGVLELAGKRPMEMTLLTTRGFSRRQNMLNVVKSDLARVGIRVLPQAIDSRDLVLRMTSSFDYESMLFGFAWPDVEPDALADLWYSNGGNHVWHPNQKQPERPWEREMDDLVSKLVRTLQPAERKRLFVGLQAIWAREMPTIPILSRHVLTAWNLRVRNVRPSILRPHLLWNADELALAP